MSQQNQILNFESLLKWDPDSKRLLLLNIDNDKLYCLTGELATAELADFLLGKVPTSTIVNSFIVNYPSVEKLGVENDLGKLLGMLQEENTLPVEFNGRYLQLAEVTESELEVFAQIGEGYPCTNFGQWACSSGTPHQCYEYEPGKGQWVAAGIEAPISCSI